MKGGPFVDDAIERDQTPMALNDFSHDAQAEPGTAVLSLAGRVGLGEPLENPRTKLFRYASPLIGDGNPDAFLGSRGGNLDARAGRRKLDRVRYQIGDRLVQPSRIGLDDGVALFASAAKFDSEARRVASIF